MLFCYVILLILRPLVCLFPHFPLQVGGKEVEWTLGFVLAEVDFTAHTSNANSAQDASAPPTAGSEEDHHGLPDVQKDLKAALRYISLANAFIQQMESSAQELVVRCRALHAQYASVVKQFMWW